MAWQPARAQAQLAWDAAGYFQYNVLGSNVDPVTGKVLVQFSVTNPLANNAPWDIKHDLPFTLPGSRLFLQVGWNTRDYTNTGSIDPSLAPRPFGGGTGAAYPMPVNALRDSLPLGDGTFLVATSKPLPFQAVGTGTVAMEGHPVVQINGVNRNVPVKSAYQNFGITDATPVPRREVVDIAKCKVCHTGIPGEEGVVIPRLSLHGGNRTEELHVCAVCHNPNQTDIPYRTSGDEQSVDFKRMVHAIHAGGFRQNPFVIIGFQGSVNDFSYVRFPKQLRDCRNCHIDNGTKGTFELPLNPGVLASTINTGSIPGVLVDVDPANDLNITPIAAVCSACHDKQEDIDHMKRPAGGASFAATQAQIDAGLVVEHCPDCHGPGRDKDVRKVHEISGGGD